VKTKRMQSIGELPTLLSTSTSLHSRPSIAGLSSDTIDADDDIPCSAIQPVDTSLNKSPINASNSDYYFLNESLIRNVLLSHFIVHIERSFFV